MLPVMLLWDYVPTKVKPGVLDKRDKNRGKYREYSVLK